MKATGIVRHLDKLGRVVLPMELRNAFELKEKDGVEIFVDGDDIVLRKYNPSCIFCGDADDIIPYEGKNVCKKCIERLKIIK